MYRDSSAKEFFESVLQNFAEDLESELDSIRGNCDARVNSFDTDKGRISVPEKTDDEQCVRYYAFVGPGLVQYLAGIPENVRDVAREMEEYEQREAINHVRQEYGLKPCRTLVGASEWLDEGDVSQVDEKRRHLDAYYEDYDFWEHVHQDCELALMVVARKAGDRYVLTMNMDDNPVSARTDVNIFHTVEFSGEDIAEADIEKVSLAMIDILRGKAPAEEEGFSPSLRTF